MGVLSTIAIGLVVAGVAFGWFGLSGLMIKEFWGGYYSEPALGWAGVAMAVIGAGVGLFYSSEAIADRHRQTINLFADEWVCTSSHTETVTIYHMVGKVMVPQPIVRSVCVTYSRRADG